ncbi:MAG: MalY/PatB family protein [Chloroflexota bacterium]
MFDFDTLPDRRNSESVKWNFYEEDVLPMWVADMDFLSPKVVIKALQERVAHGSYGYPLITKEMRFSVVDWLTKRHDWEINPEDLFFLPGVVSGFNIAAHLSSQPGDGVLVQTPTYGPFLNVAKNNNLVQQEMALTRGNDGEYYVDMDLFEATITEKTRVFMLCNPQNPTGRVFREDELSQMAEICLRNNILICSDEIHHDLVYPENKHIPVASLNPEIAANTITLIAPSKTFNIAGIKASVAVIQDPELRKKFEVSRRGLAEWVNVLGQTAMQAAYQEGAPWLEALLKYLETNRNFVYEFTNQELPGVQMTKPEGTFLAWLDCKETGIDGSHSEFFLKKARVAVNDGSWFGAGGEGFVRLNFGCPRSMLEKALHSMKAALSE